MYPFSKFTELSYSPWLGFDLIAGVLKEYTNKDITRAILQIVFFNLFVLAILQNIKDKSIAFVLFTLLAFLLYTQRFLSLRPCMLMSILFLFAIDGKNLKTGVLYVALSAFTYYLFWFYTIPIAIAHIWKGNRKFGIAVALTTGVSIIAWILLTGGHYMDLVYNVATALFQHEGLGVGENMPFIHLLYRPVIFFFSVAFLLTLHYKKEFNLLLLLIILTAPLAIQTRYFIDLTIPLMFIYVINANMGKLKDITEKIKPQIGLLLCVVSLSMFLVPQYSITPYQKLKGFEDINYPANTVFFAPFYHFQLVFFNPNPIKVIPSPEIGWNDKETKEVLKKLNKEQQLDSSYCEYFKSKGIQYVLTGGVTTDSACLTPYQEIKNEGQTLTIYQVRP